METTDIEQLYRQLSRLYSSPHNDTDEEMNSAKAILRDAIQEDGEDPEKIVKKMKSMISIEFDYKSKLSTAIKNRFWEKTFTQPIPHRRFNREQ